MPSIGKALAAGLFAGLAGGARGYQTEAQRQAEERAALARAMLQQNAPTTAQREFEWFQSLPAEQQKLAAPTVMPTKSAQLLYGLPGGKGRGKKKSSSSSGGSSSSWWD